jgi:hypothetical protein
MEPWDLRITYFNVIKFLPSFYMQRLSIATCINNLLRCVTVIGEGLFKLGIFLGDPPFSLFNILLAIVGDSSST